MSPPHSQREFFEVRTLDEALTGFRPSRRTGAERIDLGEALGRVPAEPVVAPHALPGFARATVDGYAVRAADTYGASEGLPSYLELAGEARMGRPPQVEARPGTAVAIATGAPLAPGSDAVLMVEHTQAAAPELVEVLRPVAPGDGMVRADEDAARGAELAPAGRPLRAQDLGMLAAAGVTELSVRARPRVTIVSTGDELVRPTRPSSTSGRCVTRPPSRLPPSWPRRRCSAPRRDRPRRSRRTDGDASRRARRQRRARGVGWLVSGCARRDRGGDRRPGRARDLVPRTCVSPGQADIASRLRWGSGDRPAGKPTLGAGGLPRVGVPIVRLVGACTEPPPEPSALARLSPDLPSAAGRVDVVQARVREGVATPLFGSSSLLSILTDADGYLVVPEAATGLPAGSEVEVTLYR